MVRVLEFAKCAQYEATTAAIGETAGVMAMEWRMEKCCTVRPEAED
jgi:hypothetical protein